jgi:hypothetical protein
VLQAAGVRVQLLWTATRWSAKSPLRAHYIEFWEPPAAAAPLPIATPPEGGQDGAAVRTPAVHPDTAVDFVLPRLGR